MNTLQTMHNIHLIEETLPLWKGLIMNDKIEWDAG